MRRRVFIPYIELFAIHGLCVCARFVDRVDDSGWLESWGVIDCEGGERKREGGHSKLTISLPHPPFPLLLLKHQTREKLDLTTRNRPPPANNREVAWHISPEYLNRKQSITAVHSVMERVTSPAWKNKAIKGVGCSKYIDMKRSTEEEQRRHINHTADGSGQK